MGSPFFVPIHIFIIYKKKQVNYLLVKRLFVVRINNNDL